MAPRATRTTRQALRLRLATAALALPLLLVIVWAGNPWVGAAAAAAVVVALHEAYTLAAGAGRTVLRWPGMVLGLATVSAALLDGLAVLVVFGAGSVVVFGISLYRRCVADAVRDSLTTVAASAYVALSLAAVVLLRERAMGLEWLLLVFLSVFATDTAAYFVGRVLGRRAMAPSISPGKTWEGALGGLLGGAAAADALVAVFLAQDAVVRRLHIQDGAHGRLGLAVGCRDGACVRFGLDGGGGAEVAPVNGRRRVG